MLADSLLVILCRQRALHIRIARLAQESLGQRVRKVGANNVPKINGLADVIGPPGDIVYLAAREALERVVADAVGEHFEVGEEAEGVHLFDVALLVDEREHAQLGIVPGWVGGALEEGFSDFAAAGVAEHVFDGGLQSSLAQRNMAWKKMRKLEWGKSGDNEAHGTYIQRTFTSSGFDSNPKTRAH